MNMDDKAQVIPYYFILILILFIYRPIVCNRALTSLYWIDRGIQNRTTYNYLPVSRSIDTAQDFLIAAYDNFIQVFIIT